MVYKCQNCGKFVANGATKCKHCGQEVPAEFIIEKKTSESNKNSVREIKSERKWRPIVSPTEEGVKRIRCSKCGNSFLVPKELQENLYLKCTICHQQVENPLSSVGRGIISLKKYGCLIALAVFIVITAISYIIGETNGIKADGTTIYTITENIYAPSTEAVAKNMIHSISETGGDNIAYLDFVARNEQNFTHVFQNDKVVVLKKTSSGLLIRKLRDLETAVVPTSYVRK